MPALIGPLTRGYLKGALLGECGWGTKVLGLWRSHSLRPAVYWAGRGRPCLGVGIPGLPGAGRRVPCCGLGAGLPPKSFGVRLHENSCGHLGHPPSGGRPLLGRLRPGVSARQKKKGGSGELFGLPTWRKKLRIRPRGYFFMLRSILILPDLEIPLKSQKITKKRIYKKSIFSNFDQIMI